MNRWLALAGMGVGVALFGLTAVDCTCTQVGCSSYVELLPKPIDATHEELVGGSFVGCRNDDCMTLPLVETNGRFKCGTPFDGFSCNVSDTVDAYYVDPDDDWDDGDVFTFTVHAGSGEVVFTLESEVHFQKEAPNGTFCGPTCYTDLI